MAAGSFQTMKSTNKVAVLEQIFIGEPISRAQIAKVTKLTPPTVSSMVKELIDDGLVIETTTGESIGGRKPILLSLNPYKFFSIGVHIAPNYFKLTQANLRGVILAEETHELFAGMDKDIFTELLLEKTDVFMQQFDCKDLLGIGIAAHGIIDNKQGNVIFSPYYQLHDVALQQEFEARFDVPSYLENDSRVMTWAEFWSGAGRYCDSFATIKVDQGIGGGLVINRQMIHGNSSVAGEFGHMTLDIHGEPCRCGNRGCLETLAGFRAVFKRINERMLGAGLEPLPKYDYARLQAEYEAGNEIVHDEFDKLATYLSIGIVNILHAIGSDMVIIGGQISRFEPMLLPLIRERVAARAITLEERAVPIVFSQLGDDVVSIGANILVLRHILEPDYMNPND